MSGCHAMCRCPLHYCAACSGSGASAAIVQCIRCTTAYHIRCSSACGISTSLLPCHRKLWLCAEVRTGAAQLTPKALPCRCKPPEARLLTRKLFRCAHHAASPQHAAGTSGQQLGPRQTQPQQQPERGLLPGALQGPAGWASTHLHSRRATVAQSGDQSMPSAERPVDGLAHFAGPGGLANCGRSGLGTASRKPAAMQQQQRGFQQCQRSSGAPQSWMQYSMHSGAGLYSQGCGGRLGPAVPVGNKARSGAAVQLCTATASERHQSNSQRTAVLSKQSSIPVSPPVQYDWRSERR